MVKIPGLDDLKKMGSGLMDSAKALKLGDMVDKVKTSVESVTSKRPTQAPLGDEGIKKLFEEINVSLNELMESQGSQSKAIKNIQGQLSNLSRAIEALQQPATEVKVNPETDTTEEMKKP